MTTTLFDGLFDDAALFPPGNAPMSTAVPAHRELRERLGRLVGPFVVPSGRLDELSVHLDAGPAFEVSVITTVDDLPATTRRVENDPGLSLAAVEVPAVADAEDALHAVRVLDESLPSSVPAAVEVPRSAARDEVLDVLAGTRYRAKLRTGGVRADLFPSSSELAETLHACASRDVAFKCTAGLHHAITHTDPATGFAHHGFLNLLFAVSALSAGAPVQTAADRLRDSDAVGVAAALRTCPRRHAARTRALFTSFGTCSVLEPVEDLVAVGLLPSTDRIPT